MEGGDFTSARPLSHLVEKGFPLSGFERDWGIWNRIHMALISSVLLELLSSE